MKTERPRRGMVLGLVLLLMPIAFLMMVTLGKLTITETRFALVEQSRMQAFFLAESGLNTAYHAFGNSNYSRTTHQGDGTTPVTDWNQLTVSAPGVSYDAATGWYEWSWNPGDPVSDSMTGTPVPQSFRFQVYFPQGTPDGTWRLVSQSTYGVWKTSHTITGRREPAFLYAIFDAEDLSEFVRGPNQTVTGKVHANGDLYFRPSGSTLTLYSETVTSAGKMIRFKDAWDRPDQGGTVRIAKGGPSGSLVTMEGASQGWSGQGNAYDSYHPDWTKTTSQGALSKWGGVVRDASLGGTVKNPPQVQSLEPGGYYDQNAGLRIGSNFTASWCSDKTFTNRAEDRQVTVKEIDVAAMTAAGAFPANGLVYADCSVRLVNAEKLPAGMTLVANGTLYTRGDFNMVYPDQGSYQAKSSQKKPAALITRDRIYHLSKNFNDATSGNSSIPTASDPSKYSGDPTNLVEINGALVDGAPTVDERNYVKTVDGQPNPYYNPNYISGQTCWANSDDFLENFGSTRTVKKCGSVVHLQNATMANVQNSNLTPGVTPWVIRTHYNPPYRDYSYDPLLKTNPPPFTPVVSERLLWEDTP
ncbi:MAG: PilX N-terminal domain-containing pilus assembly protein [Candidatus Eremiobacterota bacterium]